MPRPSLHTPKKRRLLPAAVLLAAAALLVFSGMAVARYVLQQQEDGVATAADFYLTSDYLKESSEGASYFIDPQAASVSIVLSNSADAQRFTTGDIAYDVEASGATVTDGGSGTLPGGVRSDVKLAVAPTEGSCTVTVTSRAPYAKVLAATFVQAQGNRFRVEDAAGNAAAVLTITCTDSGGPVSLVLPAGVVPDATDQRVTSANGACSFAPDGPGVYSVVLLKSDKTIVLAQDETSFANSIEVGGSHATL